MTPLDLEAQRERSRTSMEFERGRRREDSPGVIGYPAWLALGEVIVAWLVGIDEDEVRPVAERAHEWLEDSLARNESFGNPPSYFAVVRMDALAVACWIVGEDPVPRFAAALPLHDKAFAELAPSDDEMLDDYLPDYVRDCCAARDFDAGAAAYRRHGGRSLEREEDVRSPLELAAWICLHGGEERPFEAQTAARVLREPLLEWTGTGQGVTAGAWINLIFCEFGPHRSASEALRTARKFVAASAGA